MTFVYESDPLFSRDLPNVRKWTSYVKAFKSYCLTDRQTDTLEIIYYAVSWVASERYETGECSTTLIQRGIGQSATHNGIPVTF